MAQRSPSAPMTATAAFWTSVSQGRDCKKTVRLLPLDKSVRRCADMAANDLFRLNIFFRLRRRVRVSTGPHP